jgi:hypothetical protein
MAYRWPVGTVCNRLTLDVEDRSWLFRYVISVCIYAHFTPMLHESASPSKGYEPVPSIVGKQGRVRRRRVTPARLAVPAPLAGQRCQSPR